MGLMRSAIIYTSLAIHHEETQKAQHFLWNCPIFLLMIKSEQRCAFTQTTELHYEKQEHIITTGWGGLTKKRSE